MANYPLQSPSSQLFLLSPITSASTRHHTEDDNIFFEPHNLRQPVVQHTLAQTPVQKRASQSAFEEAPESRKKMKSSKKLKFTSDAQAQSARPLSFSRLEGCVSSACRSAPCHSISLSSSLLSLARSVCIFYPFSFLPLALTVQTLVSKTHLWESPSQCSQERISNPQRTHCPDSCWKAL